MLSLFNIIDMFCALCALICVIAMSRSESKAVPAVCKSALAECKSDESVPAESHFDDLAYANALSGAFGSGACMSCGR